MLVVVMGFCGENLKDVCGIYVLGVSVGVGYCVECLSFWYIFIECVAFLHDLLNLCSGSL